jgi:hypothetical protein
VLPVLNSSRREVTIAPSAPEVLLLPSAEQPVRLQAVAELPAQVGNWPRETVSFFITLVALKDSKSGLHSYTSKRIK